MRPERIQTCTLFPFFPPRSARVDATRTIHSLKWKPPSENSIDFKLALRFPPTPGKPMVPDFQIKPIFELHVWCGDDRGKPRYELYDVMHVEDDEWEKYVCGDGLSESTLTAIRARMKTSNEQLDDRIVEVHWDADGEHWRMMRFRDDKPNGNHKSVVDNIIKSIADGIEKDVVRLPPASPLASPHRSLGLCSQLLARSAAIRNNWKMRQGAPTGPAPAPQKPHALPAKPLPPPTPAAASLPPRPPQLVDVPPAEARYGPLATSRWSKVTGPEMVAGMYR